MGERSLSQRNDLRELACKQREEVTMGNQSKYSVMTEETVPRSSGWLFPFKQPVEESPPPELVASCILVMPEPLKLTATCRDLVQWRIEALDPELAGSQRELVIIKVHLDFCLFKESDGTDVSGMSTICYTHGALREKIEETRDAGCEEEGGEARNGLERGYLDFHSLHTHRWPSRR